MTAVDEGDGDGLDYGYGDYATTIATVASTAAPSLEPAHLLLPLPEALLLPRASCSCAPSTPLAELMEIILRYDGNAAATDAAATAQVAAAVAPVDDDEGVLVHTQSTLLRELPIRFAKWSLYERLGPFTKYSAVREASAPYGKQKERYSRLITIIRCHG